MDEFETLGRGIAEIEAQQQAERAAKVAKVAEFLKQGTFPAAWVSQEASVKFAKMTLRSSPKSIKAKAAVAVAEAKQTALRDAAIALLGLGRDYSTFWSALEVATEGLDIVAAQRALTQAHGFGFGRS